MSDLEWAAELHSVATEPAGYTTRATPGWEHFSTLANDGFTQYPSPIDVTPVSIGANVYPKFFELAITRGEAGDADDLEIYLGWRFIDGDFEHVATLSLTGASALEHVLAIKPIAFWKRKALLDLAILSRDGQEFADPDHQWTDSERDAALSRARRVLAVPTTRRKDRVTPEVLQEVADVYREAWTAGRNPTQTVADHFHKSHSTAARWVGQARKLGILGPSDGSRGGEIEVPDV